MSEQDKWRYETDGAARAEFSAITEAREQSEVEVLKKRIAELEQEYMALRLATLNAIQCMPGGQCKANLRDAYDKGGDV